MKKLTATFCLTIAVLIGSAGVSYALPKCEGDYKPTWDKCTGSTILPTGTTPSNTGDHYDGEWKDGKPHGKGVLTGVKNKNLKFVGSFEFGNGSGWGTLTANGFKYVGEFENDKQHGNGTLIFPNGDKYVGEYKNGKENGMGVLTLVKGGKYIGEWKNGIRHGQGINTFANGNKYAGEFNTNVEVVRKSSLGQCSPLPGSNWTRKNRFRRSCYGTFNYKGGETYTGEFNSKKQFHGQGSLTRKNGLIVVGTWDQGNLLIPQKIVEFQQFLKLGKHTSQKKSSLPDCKNSPAGGDRLDGKRFPSTRSPSYWGWNNCYGTHRHNYVTKFDHKLLYIGEFKNSKYHGKGTYFDYDTGDVYVGNFACGEIVTVEVIHPDGTKENSDMTDELPETCKRELVLDKQTTGLDQKEKKDMKSMSEIYQNYHPLKLCQKSGMISNRELKVVQKQTNKILKGMFFDFTEPKRSKSVFKNLKDSAWDHSILELDKNKTYQMSQFLGLGKENLSRDIRSKLKPMCSAYKGQLDNFENILNMAIREDAKKSGKTRKRDF